MICPHCNKEIEIDMDLIMEALKAESGFMKKLGEEAAKDYFLSLKGEKEVGE